MNIKSLKITAAIIAFAGVLLIAPQHTFALTTSPNPTKQAERLETVKQKADNEISQRIASLNKLITTTQALKHLSENDKKTFIDQANNEIAALTSLKTKIDNDTDVTTAQADRKTIFTQHRIYMLFIPKSHVMETGDSMSTIADLINTIEEKLQNRVNAAKNAGKDVTALQNALNDIQAKTADAKTQYQTAENTVSPLVPDGGDEAKMNSNKAALQTARNDIKAGEADLKTARADIQIVVNGLKSLR